MPNSISFFEALSVLSKDSPFAVSTEKIHDPKNLLQQIKEDIYITMPIEDKVITVIQSIGLNNKKLVFLCGSSGDGKSEILTRCKKDFDSRVDFHLDATHSFSPNESAIQTLDNEFSKYEVSSKPLVVGINTGMLGNYGEDGSNEFIKENIQKYLQKKDHDNNIIFINFEDYPKFEINEHGYTAEFPKKILENLTQTENNLLRQLFDKDRERLSDSKSTRLFVNYQILSIPTVQKSIIELLFKARLIRDQFLTARALLDFIFGLLAGPGYLFDNLFMGGDNELAEKIVEFDPANLRTKEIDRFILSHDLELHEPEFTEFKIAINNLGIEKATNAFSYLRLFYIFNEFNFSNNFHQKFHGDFSESLIEKYVSYFQLHKDYAGGKEGKSILKDFYHNILRDAVHKYINRNNPSLGKKQYLIKDLGAYLITAQLEISFDEKRIANTAPNASSFFNAFLKVDGEPIKPIPVNINLLKLLINIVQGYRPNKHDKSTVVLLDELIEDISKVASQTNEIHVIGNNSAHKLTKIEDEIEVEDVENA